MGHLSWRLYEACRFNLYLLLLSLFVSCSFAQDTGSSSGAATMPEQALYRDIVYCGADGVDLKMDLYPSKMANNKPAPVVVYIHGGGWYAGDKSTLRETWLASAVAELTARGYIVAAPNYRLAPQYKWPAQIEDAKCAVRHLRANASTYQLDPNRIGAWGRSAGGHLVALLGLSDANIAFEGDGGYPEQPSSVQAVVDMFGPTDLKTFAAANVSASRMANQAFGQDPEVLESASPVNYVSKGAPPFLILHGSGDQLVPPSQSQELHARLNAAGVPTDLVIVENAGHTFPRSIGENISPTHQEIKKMIANFFDRNLGDAN
jgi:acetyl esterase/lipase